ncbi:PaaI family thioesterase [Streptomyces justiciae]|uniref:PaaI family thioesterase n=1 Tax=Streptomyces justiciae TaxID=2780140 RepID=UPI00187DED41|nr:PaaI family thioesterase [Streptomyces justiciae]MBE8477408.1 PaaI family thioesterase [Streptomyces justiciae]
MNPETPQPAQRGTGPTVLEDDLQQRRRAVTALGDELRALVDAAVGAEAPTETLHLVADAARRLTDQLVDPRRLRASVPAIDDFATGRRFYNPVSGKGNPLAPPIRVETTADTVTGHCTLSLAHEGPPGYAHGGMSAMLLDELMGLVCLHNARPSMTVALTTRYLRPVPLDTPLRAQARITRTENRKTYVHGSIATETHPAQHLVEAEGVFVSPDLDHSRALFPHLPLP